MFRLAVSDLLSTILRVGLVQQKESTDGWQYSIKIN